MENYKKLIEMGLDHSVARQVLPNAMRNNLVMTGNLREWKNFLAQRLCGRNTSEIEYIAYLIYKELEKYNPLVMKYTGPACKVFGKCNQGDKSCGQIYLEEKYKGKISSKVDGEDWNLLSESYFNSILNINKNFLDDENNYCVLTNDYIKKTEIAKIYGLYFYREKRINFTKENRKYWRPTIRLY